jgi:hypothetical protein
VQQKFFQDFHTVATFSETAAQTESAALWINRRDRHITLRRPRNHQIKMYALPRGPAPATHIKNFVN